LFRARLAVYARQMERGEGDNMNRWLLRAAAALAVLGSGAAFAAADIFPTSSQSLITDPELSGLTCDGLWHARNEIYARHGYIFETARGQQAFGSGGTTHNPKFNAVEQKNIANIQAYEASFHCS
jgi:hypothetical protein